MLDVKYSKIVVVLMHVNKNCTDLLNDTFDSNIEQNLCMKLSIRRAIFSREMDSCMLTINQEMSLHCFIRIFFWNSMDENFQIFRVFEFVWTNHISHTMRHAPTHQHTWADDHSKQIHWGFSWQWQKKMLMTFYEKSTEQIVSQSII